MVAGWMPGPLAGMDLLLHGLVKHRVSELLGCGVRWIPPAGDTHSFHVVFRGPAGDLGADVGRSGQAGDPRPSGVSSRSHRSNHARVRQSRSSW